MAKKRKIKLKKSTRFIALFVVLLAIPITLILLSRPAIFFPNAQNVQATIEVISPTDKIPPSTTATVQINSGSYELGFAQVTILFDKNKIQLTDDVTTTNLLNTVVDKTSMAEANASGKIDISLGLAPQDRDNPPSGRFTFASFPIRSISTADNDTTVISVDQAQSQLVDQTPQALVLAGQNLDLTLNYVASTATATATATASAKPSSNPLSTKIPRVVTGGVPTESPTDTPTYNPTTSPSATPDTTSEGDNTPSQNTNQVTWTIQSSQDIANEDNGWFYDSGTSLNIFVGNGKVPENSYLGLRFSGPTIVANTQIKSAKLGFTASRDQWINLGFKVYGELSSAPLAFTTSNRMSSRDAITSSESFSDNVKWNAQQVYYYDVTDQVNEIVSNSQSDLNAIVLIMQGEGSSYARKSIIANGSGAPKLVIDYNNSGSGDTQTSGTNASGSSDNVFNRIFSFFRNRFWSRR